MIRFEFPQGHPMARVTYTPDSLAVVTAHPHTGVFVRDRFTGQTIREFLIPNGVDYEQLTVSDCGRFLGVRHSKRFEAFDLRALDETACISGGVLTAFALVGSTLRAVNRFAGAGQIFTWALPEAAPHPVVPVRTSGTVIAMSPNGNLALAVRQRGNPQLVELASGETVAELRFPLRRHSTGILGFAVFSPDSGKLALANGERIALFDLTEADWSAISERPLRLSPRSELERPDPHDGGTVKDRRANHWLPPLAFTPDGRHFITLGLRERVQLYDTPTARVAEQWGWRMNDVTCLAVAPDGATAVAGGRRGRMTLWDLG